MSDQSLEQRVAALETQGGGGGGGGGAASGGGGDDPTVQAFLQGAVAAYAMSQGGQGGGQGLAGGGSTEQGIFGWNPTKYDSRLWCRSRFMCNPQSISCLC